LPFTSIRLGGGLAPPSDQTCSAHKKAGQVRLAGRGRGAYWENAGPREAP
jgi:hypothetical protein